MKFIFIWILFLSQMSSAQGVPTDPMKEKVKDKMEATGVTETKAETKTEAKPPKIDSTRVETPTQAPVVTPTSDSSEPFILIEKKPSTDIQIGGYFDAGIKFISMPTGQRAQIPFDLRGLRIQASKDTNQGVGVDLEYDVTVPKLVTGSVMFNELQVGLLKNSWIEELYSYKLRHRLSSFNNLPLGLKYKYDSESDTGLKVHHFFDDHQIDVVISVVNGEGSMNKENGTNKEWSFMLEKQWAHAKLMLGYAVGAYDLYSGGETRKQRMNASLDLYFENDYLQLEYQNNVDPALALIAMKVADQVDLTGYSGELISSDLARVLYYHTFDENWGSLLFFDYVKPNKKQGQQDITGGALGLVYAWSPEILINFAIEKTNYGERHLGTARDSEFLSLATRVDF